MNSTCTVQTMQRLLSALMSMKTPLSASSDLCELCHKLCRASSRGALSKCCQSTASERGAPDGCCLRCATLNKAASAVQLMVGGPFRPLVGAAAAHGSAEAAAEGCLTSKRKPLGVQLAPHIAAERAKLAVRWIFVFLFFPLLTISTIMCSCGCCFVSLLPATPHGKHTALCTFDFIRHSADIFCVQLATDVVCYTWVGSPGHRHPDGVTKQQKKFKEMQAIAESAADPAPTEQGLPLRRRDTQGPRKQSLFRPSAHSLTAIRGLYSMAKRRKVRATVL